ncbi:MAG: methylated-DNA--[protein]-cysteine S-methyltransferase, partial [Myxococcales bacterium]|nr:methylated-DNA--[protein]-cysteine S-methyltransferase [Myxococcales bacterium]
MNPASHARPRACKEPRRTIAELGARDPGRQIRGEARPCGPFSAHGTRPWPASAGLTSARESWYRSPRFMARRGESERWALARVDHPQVPLALAVDAEGALVAISFSGEASVRERARARGIEVVDGEGHGDDPSVPARARAGLERAAAQLREYLAGDRRDFDLTLRPSPSGTDFQRRAWDALKAIPYGETRTYAEQAAAIGAPTASR